MLKKIIWGVAALLVLGLVLLLIQPRVIDKNSDKDASDTARFSSYFQERISILGAQRDRADVLIVAFPRLVAEDFRGVETFGGIYEVSGGEIDFVRDGSEPATSAESALSEEGYETLLVNVSLRLDMPVTSKSDVDKIIEIISTKERLEVKIGEMARGLGVAIRVEQVLEDSRCPEAYECDCVQSCSIKIQVAVGVEEVITKQVFRLGETVEVSESRAVAFVDVTPAIGSWEEIAKDEYRFIFEVNKKYE